MADHKGWLTPELRATAYYFTFFMTSGAATAYGGIWFANDQGLSAGEIGLINSLPTFIMLVLNLVVGRLADRAEDWRRVIVIGALLGGIIPIGLFFAHGFWPILILWTLAALPVAAVGPVQDAATLRMTRRNGTDFGFIRACGTLGFLAIVALTGPLVSWLGAAAFLPFFVALALLRGGASLGLPNFRAPKEVPTLATGAASRMREVMRPWFLLPLVGWSMIAATHLILNGFQALLWKQQGLPDVAISLLIALGAASEATMMIVFKRFVGRFPARLVILISAIVSTLRWIAFGFAPDIPFLVVLQLLHSVTFAMGYMGCVHFIANWTSEDIAAEAQSFFQVLQQGMGVVAVAGFGVLAGMFGYHAYFASAAFAAIGGVMILISMRLMQPKTDRIEIHA
jgi:MFS transporter, PPP family, 3-phenylpropionic acid transporter